MYIRISRRHPVARYLTKKMVDDRWAAPELSSVANVTPMYVTYLMNFATEEWQIWFLLDQMKKHARSKCTKPYTWVDVHEVVKSKLVPNISTKSQEIYLQWRKHEN